MNNKIKMIKNGKEVEAEIIRYVKVGEKKFVLYSFDDREDVYASLVVDKETGIELHDVSDEDMDLIESMVRNISTVEGE